MLNDYTMKTANSLITLILLLTAVFSVVTSTSTSVTYASTNESDEGSEPDDSGGAEPAPNSDENGFDNNGDGDALNKGDVPAANDEDYTVTCWNGEEISELSDCPDQEPEIPNCDFDEFLNEDNECEKIPEDPVTAALPPCDGTLQNCVTPAGDVCLAGASTHECEESVTCPYGVTVVEELSECPEPVVADTLPFPDEEGPGPDEDCLFDTTLEKCAEPPGGCPEGFFTNEDNRCFPDHTDEGCPPGYHTTEDDETGECNPNEECSGEGYILVNNGESCREKRTWCIENPQAEECKVNEGKGKNYDPELPDVDDLDCDKIGGSNIRVIGDDPYDLDRDGDGIGCETNGNDDEWWWKCDVPWYMTCDSQVKKNNDNNNVIQKTTVINSATTSASATTTAISAEVSSCRLDGSADGILQKFDTSKYETCGLYERSESVL
jgi:hypothetical protein